MMTLYYAPGACSMASHITLEETGAPYETRALAMQQGEHKTPEYLKINSRGKVPALRIDDDQVIVENVAIQYYLSKRFPEAKLAPADALGEARWLSTNAWFSNTVHPSFTHVLRPAYFADGEAAQASVSATGKKTFWANLQEIDRLLDGRIWVQGAQFTTSDAYALVFYGWGNRVQMPVAELKNYTAWKNRMLQRPAVRKVVEREGDPTKLAA